MMDAGGDGHEAGQAQAHARPEIGSSRLGERGAYIWQRGT